MVHDCRNDPANGNANEENKAQETNNEVDEVEKGWGGKREEGEEGKWGRE